MVVVYSSLPMQNCNCENIFFQKNFFFFLKKNHNSATFKTVNTYKKQKDTTYKIRLSYEKVAQNIKDFGAPVKKTEPF